MRLGGRCIELKIVIEGQNCCEANQTKNSKQETVKRFIMDG